MIPKERKAALAAAACAAGALALLLHYASGMTPQEALRRLSGMRVAVTLYRLEHKAPPASFAELVRSGKLEAAPELKLPRHRGSALVRDVAAMKITDSGGWAYVNDPKSPDFGLVYIDCSHRDGKGRFWSEF